MSLTYSTIEVVEDKSTLSERIKKDLFFIVILVLGGVLPSIGVY